MKLTNKQYKGAAIFYGKHKNHVDTLAKSVTNAYPPTLAEDQNNPAIWKANHWKWFLSTNIPHFKNHMKLTPQNVEEIFLACLFKEGEDFSNAVKVQGVMMNVGFHPERLEQNRFAITELLLQCHDDFMESSEAKGMSFLNFCVDKSNEQWTGMHSVCDNLICLGLAIGKVVFLLPREVWQVLPGGMPYLQIKNVLINEA